MRAHCCRWIALIALSLGASACTRAPVAQEETSCPDVQTAGPIDPPLLAFLSRARAAHHLADQLEASDPAAAIARLQELTGGPEPDTGGPRRPEIREVLADTYARLADLESRRGGFGAAQAHIERGLGLAREITYFRGHLLEVRGHVYERQGEALAGTGDSAGAREARQRALAAFESAMKLQARVIECSLQSGSP